MNHNFKKKFGQNFIKSIPHVIELIENLQLNDHDHVIEIGPGDGKVTQILIEKAKGLTSIEIDHELIPTLKALFSKYDNFDLINQDILQFDVEKYLKEHSINDYKLTGSLPYNISKNIIEKFSEISNKPKIISVIMQKEVAQDFAAKPPKSSFLHHLYSPIYEITYVSTINKDLFYPEPKVHGGIVKFIKKEKPLIESSKFKDYAKFLKNAYFSPRKKLIKVLKMKYPQINWPERFKELEIKPNARPAELSTKDFIKLFLLF